MLRLISITFPFVCQLCKIMSSVQETQHVDRELSSELTESLVNNQELFSELSEPPVDDRELFSELSEPPVNPAFLHVCAS